MGQADPEAILSEERAVVIEAQWLRLYGRFWISAKRGCAPRRLDLFDGSAEILSGTTTEG